MIGKFSTSVLNIQLLTEMYIYPSYCLPDETDAPDSKNILVKRSKKNDVAKGNRHQIAAASRKLDG